MHVASVVTTGIKWLSAIGIGTVATAGWRMLRWRRAQRLFRFQFRRPVDVVVNTRGDAPEARGMARADLWSTAIGNVNALMELSRGIRELHNGTSVRVQVSRARVPFLDDLVLLGGNNENEQTDTFLRCLAYHCGQAKVVYDDRDERQNVLGIDGETWPYDWISECKERGASGPLHDYGLVVAWVNPFTEDRRRAILCAGFTAAGTDAVARRLFRELPREAIRRLRWTALRRLLRRDRPCFALAYEFEFGDDRVTATRLLGFTELRDVRPDELREWRSRSAPDRSASEARD
jgi:hypothetical protein